MFPQKSATLYRRIRERRVVVHVGEVGKVTGFIRNRGNICVLFAHLLVYSCFFPFATFNEILKKVVKFIIHHFWDDEKRW